MGRKSSGDVTADWLIVNKDVADYHYLCSMADEYLEDRKPWDQIMKRFIERRTEWLAKEGFQDHLARSNDDYYTRDDQFYYSNNALSVYVKNYGNSDFKDGRDKYLYPDYYEERP